MGLFRKFKEMLDPLNKMTPAQVVASIPAVWVRVPICICAGYFDTKKTEAGVVDQEAILSAIAGTDIQVYGREETTVCEGKPYIYAVQTYSQMKDGTEKEKLEDATFALLMGELIEGGTNISSTLAIQTCDLGFQEISKSLIGNILATSTLLPPKVIEAAMVKAMSFAD